MEWHVKRDNTIEHHGIDGMHWGERNGPPYPLSREKHNKVVRSAKDDASKTKAKVYGNHGELKKNSRSDERINDNRKRFNEYSDRLHNILDKPDPVLYETIVSNNKQVCEQFAENTKKYYDYLHELAPEFARSIIKGATAEEIDDQLQNDWDIGDLESSLYGSKRDAKFNKLQENKIDSDKKMDRIFYSELDKYLGEGHGINSSAIDEMQERIEHQVVKNKYGKNARDMSLDATYAIFETMWDEYNRITGEK